MIMSRGFLQGWLGDGSVELAKSSPYPKLALESTLQRVTGLGVWSTESLEGEIRPLA